MFCEAILGGLIVLFLTIMAIVFGLAVMVFWIWMLVDAIQNKRLSDGEKIGWVLAIVFLHFLGSILYFFIGRAKRA
jgi:uncharacterized membrane protein YhaH (DUF805 family)